MKKAALLLVLAGVMSSLIGCSGDQGLKPEDSMEKQLKEAAKANNPEPENKRGMKVDKSLKPKDSSEPAQPEGN